MGLYDEDRFDEKIFISSADADYTIKKERFPSNMHFEKDYSTDTMESFPTFTLAEKDYTIKKERFPSNMHFEKGFSNNILMKQSLPQWICNRERYIIPALLLVIIALTVMVIILSITAGNLKFKESEGNSSCSLAGASIDQVTEIKILNSAPCEDDWIWYREKCYYFSIQRDTWNNSQSFCILHNASLALIDNKKELDFFFQFKGSDNFWIGLGRTDDNKSWTWTNGTSYNESLFKIKRISYQNTEHVFLNHEGVSSNEGSFEFKWICNKL